MSNETKFKLLIVDDEPDNLDLLYRTFRRNFQVFKAENPQQAFSVLEHEGEMAIIISDQKMPYMTGTEFLCQTVEQYPDTIRILLTGYPDIDYLVEAINTGKVFKYLTKPWNPQDLKIIVQQATETYQLLKQRTDQLRKALRQEELFNQITTSLRESLDYEEMLQRIVEAIAKNWSVKEVVLTPVEEGKLSTKCLQIKEKDSYNLGEELQFLMKESLQTGQTQINQINNYLEIAIPLIFQQKTLAILALYQVITDNYWYDTDLKLLEAVAEQAALAMSQAKLYQQLQQQTAKMRHELEVARQIQSNLLRQTWQPLNNVKIEAICNPAAEVGGDFFEVYIHPQGDIWLAVGDVSGKGVPAALLMASAISLLRRELAQETSPKPELVMKNLNQIMSDDLFSTNCFVTLFLARYTPNNRQLSYCNAGHIYPLIWSLEKLKLGLTTVPKYLKLRGIPLGILPIWRGEAGEISLNKGEILLLLSDGITEATVTEHSLLNQEGLWELIRSQSDFFSLNFLFQLFNECTNPNQEDDQTMVSLEILQ
jgi:serine phosphatase RsbU (regulator of sigma subunit)/FixJ family two-component response regulator